MLQPEQIDRVYLYRAAVDMRRQRNGLAALAQEVLKVNPFSGALCVFIGKRRDRIKCLWWDGNGFVVWYKVIEGKERYAWPRHVEEEQVVTLSAEQLRWLLAGYDVWKMKPHQSQRFLHAA